MKIAQSLLDLLEEMDTPASKALRRAYELKNRNPRSACTCEECMEIFRERKAKLEKRTARLLAPALPGDAFAYREKDGLISYTPAGRDLVINDDGQWQRQGRQEMKPGKWIKSILSPRLIAKIGGDKAVADFAAKFGAYERGDAYTLEPAPFEEAYKYENFVRPVESCMWNDPVGNWYRQFPCDAMIIKKEGANIGRTILWSHVSHPDFPAGIKYMDRIYAAPAGIIAAEKWAWSRGIYTKTLQQVGCKMARRELPDGTMQEIDMRGAQVAGDFDTSLYVAYMDTFDAGNASGDKIQCSPRGWNHSYSFTTTCGEAEGGPDEHEGEVQDIDGEWIPEEEAHEINGNYYHRDSDAIVYCSHGSCAGEYILVEDAYTIDLGGRIGTVTVHNDDVSSCI